MFEAKFYSFLKDKYCVFIIDEKLTFRDAVAITIASEIAIWYTDFGILSTVYLDSNSEAMWESGKELPKWSGSMTNASLFSADVLKIVSGYITNE